jgi:hypothetical protein
LENTVFRWFRSPDWINDWLALSQLGVSSPDLRQQSVTVRPRDFHRVDTLPRAVWTIGAAMLDLPIWFLTERTQERISLHPPCDERGAVIAFSTTEKLTAFLAGRQSGEWNLHLVADRAELILIIAIAHNRRMESIRIDPDLTGFGGQQVSLNELMSLANSVTQRND